MAPATIRKGGSNFDIPIAIAVLKACGKIMSFEYESTLFIGELGLDGAVNGVIGALPMCIEAKKRGFKRIIIPSQNELEAGIVEGIDVIAVKSLSQLIGFLNNQVTIFPSKFDLEDVLKCRNLYNVDFSEVKGQKNVKRAIEVAASGGHNCILIGSPGSGKTMIAKRILTILPSLTFDESLEVTKIHSIAGNINENMPILVNRPFIAPHHTISQVSLVGGGANPKPGDISLANYGVLFLDELPEFDRNKLETLRGPLEDRKISISRLNYTVTYPCNFMLVASMNPCPCGYYGYGDKCKCSNNAIRRYLSKVSGPILDRIDIQVEVSGVDFECFTSDEIEESSYKIRKRVEKARAIQIERYKNEGIFSNSELTDRLIEKYCIIDGKCQKILELFVKKKGLSGRAYKRILKVARTIADMDCSEEIQEKHILEAMQYRNLDNKY